MWSNSDNLATPSPPDSPTTSKRLATTTNHDMKPGPRPVAICGMALRLPGGIRDPSAFWEALLNQTDLRRPIPSDRYNAAGFTDALARGRQGGHIKTGHGYFLDEDLTVLDTSFFAMSRTEVERCDPQQRQLLEVAREALESAGERDYRGKPIGCYVGTFGEDWLQMAAREQQHSGGYLMTGHGDLMLANRLSFEYDLKGPSMVIKTGCSASLIGLHEACRALQSGDCTGAIIAGANLVLGPVTTAAMTEEGMLAPDGMCKTFDAAADGYARGEAINAVYIKLLDDAIRDNNPIRAVIRNTGTNNDGKSQSLLTPNSAAHEALMRKVYSDIALDPSKTAFVECHGTGTPTGDPLEANAVGNVFGSSGVYIGSVKPNVGHSEGASGLTSLIKGVLALENETIPPNLRFKTPNPKIPFESKKLVVPVKPESWPVGRDKRVSINSFGIGGSNAHVILEAPPPSYSSSSSSSSSSSRFSYSTSSITAESESSNDNSEYSPTSPSTVTDEKQEEERNAAGPHLLLFSANTENSLKLYMSSIQSYISIQMEKSRDSSSNSNINTLNDMAYTLARHREVLPHRAYMVVNPDGTIAETSPPVRRPVISSESNNSNSQIVMVFSGQGAQWPQMGKDLFETSEGFRQDIRQMDLVLKSLMHPPDWSLESELFAPPAQSRINEAEISQPLCTALQIALVRHVERAGGIRPSAVVGHSSGEIAAAYAAGALTLEEALLTAYYRGYVTKEGKEKNKNTAAAATARVGGGGGGMAAVGLGVNEATAYLKPGVVIACDNSPRSVTLSGDVGVLESVLDAIKAEKPDTLARRLKVDMAYHSHQMTPLAARYQAFLEEELRNVVSNKTSNTTTTTTNNNDNLEDKTMVNIPMYSTVVSSSSSQEVGVITPGRAALGPSYWVSNLTSRVEFTGAIRRILRDKPNSLFIEIGPHSTLSGPIRQIAAAEAGTAAAAECRYVSTMRRGENASNTLLSAFGQLFQFQQEGAAAAAPVVDWATLFPASSGSRVLTDLPRYAWDHSSGSFWYEARVSRESRFRQFGHHRLLGLRIPESSGIEPGWRNMLRIADEPWLVDHRIRSDVVFPFAGYIAMAGEAIRQVTGVEGGYRIRRAMARSAMVLSGDQPIEIVTTLKPVKLTDMSDSSWYEFRVVSYSGSSWIKHCEGQVKACSRPDDEVVLQTPCLKKDALVRKVPSTRWYDAMERIGVVYGPAFQALKDISSSATEHLAAATIAQQDLHQDPAFVFHPIAIDACLQLLLVAMVKGIGRNFGRLRVPTVIEDLYVSRSAPEMDVFAVGPNSSSSSSKQLAIEVMADGKLALRLSGLELTSVDDGHELEDGDTEPHAAARLEWLPDFDLVDHATLFNPPRSIPDETRIQEEMTLLCMLETADRVRNLKACNWHFEKFRDWLELEIKRARDGTYPVLGEHAKAYLTLPSAVRDAMINDRYYKLQEIGIGSKGAVAIGIKRIYDNCEAIFTGQTDTLDTLMQGDVLTRIYDAVSFGKGDFFKLLAHSRPDLRILEVGAGTGGTTEMILRNLVRPHGLPAYSVYTFTDISAGFFPQARERFSYAPNMDYRIFDISKNPFDQGFEEESYDIVLAPNVIHATPSLHETLSNLQPLLRPGGLLVLTELCAVARTPNYIFGNFSGWWLGDADGRAQEPYVPVDRWDTELKAAGFSGVDTAVRDAEEPFHYCAAIVSTKIDSRVPETGIANDNGLSGRISILSDEASGTLTEQLVGELEKMGNSVDVFRLGEATKLPPPDQDIVSLLDLDTYFFENISEERLAAFQHILNRYKSGSIVWLTKPAQVGCKDPRSAQSIGVARSIRAESRIPFYTLEIDAAEPHFSQIVSKVLAKIRRSRDAELLAPDKEYVVDGGIVKIGRYHPFLVRQELQDASASLRGEGVKTDDIKSLQTSKAGSLARLNWVSELGSAPDRDEVVIETRAVGINFKDVLYAMDILKPTMGNDVPLGLEIAGIVSRVGADVSNLAVGDRVMAMPPSASFKTLVTTPATLVQKIPDGLSFEDAATMPICYATAIESLLNIGQLEPGQSVLIHSAAGGVGHAAIQLCQSIGAKIFATVGNQAKVDYLVQTFGIPRNHIFHSRDESFAVGLLRETGGHGVDIVLNSVAGELLHASWDCVAEFGKMIELGKRDIGENGKLGMRNFLESRSYSAVDLTHLAQKRPRRAQALLKKCMDLYEANLIGPIRPIRVFEAGAVQDAFGMVQDSSHIGKVVVRMPTDSAELASSARATEVRLKSDASYLLTGGLGGLGKAISTWLVERGARSLVFLSRSAGQKAEDAAFIRELEACGCSVVTVAGHVENMLDVRRAVAQAPHAVKGVIHLAMVLRDSAMATMGHDDWVAANSPKVTGAWNLHEALQGQDVDFFVMASSLVTVVEQPGQGNYSAANTFLEAFAQYRRMLSLPASVLNICPIDGIGFVAENAFARKNMKAQGLWFVGEAELLDFLELAIRLSPSTSSCSTCGRTSTGQLVMGLRGEGNLNSTDSRTNWRRDRRMGFYHNVREESTTNSSSSSSAELVAFLKAAADNVDVLDEPGSSAYLAREVGRKTFSLMLKTEEDLDLSLTLHQIGLDSLMAIELRRWLKQAFGLDMSVLEIMAQGTLEAFGSVIAKALKERFRGA